MKPSFDPKVEGACLLYDGVRKEYIAGEKLKRKTTNPNNAKNTIGYLAYPNPNLKNKIPDQLFYEYKKLKKRKSSLPFPNGAFKTTGRLITSVNKSKYIKNINRIKKLLSAGEVYQINYAIRFKKRFFGDPYTLFYKLMQRNPASFSAYLNCGNFQILSASPERLFKIKNRIITTQPIKGTIRKDKNIKLLLESNKERAELDMITDLERNDLGRICDYGSVKVTKERALLELPNMWHTYSEIRGRLRKNTNFKDIIEAIFPSGSISGCPKIRAMEYIEKLEKLPRNIFSGTIGFIAKNSMDFNIGIRTILIYKGYVEFWAGGGIVWDSVAEKEYEECLLKAERIVEALN